MFLVLIMEYESKEYEKELLNYFLTDLKYYLGEDNGTINLNVEDVEFFSETFLNSTDYQEFRKKFKKK